MVRRKGLLLRVTSNEASAVTIELSVNKATARRLRINRNAQGPVVVGRVSRAVVPGRTEIVVKLTRKARARLAKAANVKLMVSVKARDPAGNMGDDTLAVTLRR